MSEPRKSVLMFTGLKSPIEAFVPAVEKVLAGQPQQTVANHYSDASGQFHSGEWTGEPGCWTVNYSEHEFCYLTRGRVRLTDESGAITEIKAGEAFIIPAGFKGTWEVLASAHKYYVIFELRQE